MNKESGNSQASRDRKFQMLRNVSGCGRDGIFQRCEKNIFDEANNFLGPAVFIPSGKCVSSLFVQVYELFKSGRQAVNPATIRIPSDITISSCAIPPPAM